MMPSEQRVLNKGFMLDHGEIWANDVIIQSLCVLILPFDKPL